MQGKLNLRQDSNNILGITNINKQKLHYKTSLKHIFKLFYKC